MLRLLQADAGTTDGLTSKRSDDGNDGNELKCMVRRADAGIIAEDTFYFRCGLLGERDEAFKVDWLIHGRNSQ